MKRGVRMFRLVAMLAMVLYAAAFVAAVVAADRPGVVVLELAARQEREVGVEVRSAEENTSGVLLAREKKMEEMSEERAGAMVGFAISFHHQEDVGLYLKAIDELVELGVNSVEIVTPGFQENGASETIRILPGKSADREHLLAVLRHAKAKGLRTALMPIVLFSHPRGNEWRGKINPEKWDAWWNSYQQFLDYFLKIAREAKVDAVGVGSELLSTEKQTARWEKMIGRARSQFEGALYYSTNWDHYHVPTFWDELDYIGISCYWDVTTYAGDPQKPEMEAVARRWREIKGQVLAFGRMQGKPVLLTEVGYPSLPWGLKDPWNYVNSKGVMADHGIQALGYLAFLESWGDVLIATVSDGGGHGENTDPLLNNVEIDDAERPDSMAGVFFYSWEPWNKGGAEDTGYGIRGKPAFDIVRKWLKKNVGNR